MLTRRWTIKVYVAMERVRWAQGKTVFFGRVAQLRPPFRSADPALHGQAHWKRVTDV
jgi:hypothetical protein